MTTTSKTPRSLRLTALTPDLTYVVVSEGRKVDAYRLDVGYRSVRWVHTGDAGRGGIVCINGAGKAVGCDCKAAIYGRNCRHRQATEVMIARGMIEVGVVTEAAEAMADVPKSWMHATEGRE